MLGIRFKYLARVQRCVKHPRLLCSFVKVRDVRNRKANSLVRCVQERDSMLHIHWNDRSVSRFPFIYLRDICNCPECLDATSLQRKLDTIGQIDLDIKAKCVHITEDGEKLKIKWPDNHLSEFDSSWLRQNRLEEKEGEEETNQIIARKGIRLWNREDMQDKIPGFIYEDILKKDDALYDWLLMLDIVGIALLYDVPSYADPIPSSLALAQRIGYLKSTHYGFKFDVHAKVDANNLAYTTSNLPLHCDIPQSEYYPGVQFLHCIEQVPTKGGSNMFVDGFKIAQDFKDVEPELFELLSVTQIPYVDIGVDVFGDFHLERSRPVIEVDHNKKIRRYTYNNHTRDYYLNSTPDKVCDVYTGYMMLGKMMRDPKNRIDHKLKPGEMVTFNNSRVLHGRYEFTPTKTGNRHLQGTYLDWDLIYARLRSLSRSLGRHFHD